MMKPRQMEKHIKRWRDKRYREADRWNWNREKFTAVPEKHWNLWHFWIILAGL